MIPDLALELELRVLPTVRDADGLALSSRNARSQRLRAGARTRASTRPRNPRPRTRAQDAADGLDVDYVEVAPFDPPVLAAAVRIGSTRLIDNVPLEEAS